MIRALAYLLSRTTWNRLKVQLGKLKNPRYALALVLGVAYLWFLLLQPSRSAGSGFGAGGGGSGVSLSHEWIAVVMALGLLGMVAWGWVFGGDKAVLIYSPAEVHYLFPAPVTRRHLVGYKLFRAQIFIVLNVGLWLLLLGTDPREGGGSGLPLVARGVSLWVLFSTIHLHRIGASFVRTTLARHGMAGAKRRVVSLAVIAVVVAVLGWGVITALPGLRQALRTDLGSFLDALASLAHQPIPTVVLFPFRLVVDPLIARGVGQWAAALVPAVGILALHVVWVIRSDAAFEEASAAASLERARAIESFERGGLAAAATHGPRGRGRGRGRGRPVSPPVFRLDPEGHPAMAILWKNIVAVGRARNLRRMALIGLLTAAVFVAMLAGDTQQWGNLLSGLLAGWAGVLLVFGPLWVRNDLRSDLSYIDVLRAYPIGGATVVGAEAAASAAVLTAAQLGLLGLALVASLSAVDIALSVPARGALLAAIALVLPAINFLGMLIQNGIALLFPAWVTLGPRRRGGVEALGQSLLSTMPYLVLLTLALAAPAAVATGAASLLDPLIGTPAYVVAAGLFFAGLALEGFLLIEWLGGVYERLDPSAVELATRPA